MGQVQSPEEILTSTRAKYSKAIEGCRPFFALFEVTNSCALTCKYPIIDGKYCGLTSNLGIGEPELGIDQIRNLVDNIARGGTTSLSLIGGEPTLRPDLFDIIAYAALRLDVTLVTNGQLLDAKYVKRLKAAGVSWVKIYLDSPAPQIHDSVRGNGTHERAYQAVLNCKREGLRVSIITTISQLNYRHIREMVRLALESKSIIEFTEFLVSSGSNLSMTREQRRQAQMEMLEAQRLFGRDQVRFGSYYIVSQDQEGLAIWANPDKKGSNVGYPWGIYGYGIKSNGIMVPDPLITLPLGDLRSERLSDIWPAQVMLKNLRHRGRLKGKCGRCEFRFVCGGHRGRVYAATQDFMGEDDACWYEPQLT